VKKISRDLEKIWIVEIGAWMRTVTQKPVYDAGNFHKNLLVQKISKKKTFSFGAFI
jgi:hypothetical protein